MYLLLVNGKIRDKDLVTDTQGSGIKMMLEGRKVFMIGQYKRHLR